VDLKFEFSYKTKTIDSFRCKSLIGQYDLENKETIQNFSGDYKLPNKWNIGLIVGNSGSGKTSIAKNVFGDFSTLQWDEKPIIENFDSKLKMDEITFALGSVGFNTIPYWLKPFNVLSNGEKARVELARMAMEKDLIVYDEFTSLVDRDVAKSMANSVQKMFRKVDKKFVAVTCHHDVLDWLQPDWVYDTDNKEFFCPKFNEGKSSNSRSQEQKKNHGIFIKSIII
jgi:energy-coupling factor transporter ATP-binding protein EcfA2